MAKKLAETSTIPNLFVLFFIINVKIKLFDKIGFILKINDTLSEETSIKFGFPHGTLYHFH